MFLRRMAMISFQDVNKHYGHFHVLKNINLHIKKGKSSLSSDLQDREKHASPPH